MQVIIHTIDQIFHLLKEPPSWFLLIVISYAVSEVLKIIIKHYFPVIKKTSAHVIIIELIMTIMIAVITAHVFFDNSIKSHGAATATDNTAIICLIIFVGASFLSMGLVLLAKVVEKQFG